MRSFVLLFFFLTLTLPGKSGAKVVSDSSLFLPDSGTSLTRYQQAPISWWNFLFFNSKEISREQACQALNTLPKEQILFNPCEKLPLAEHLIDQWGLETLMATPPPANAAELKSAFNRTLVQLSMPVESSTLNFMRNNPLVNFGRLGQEFSKFYHSEKAQGDWQSLPFLLNYPPSDSASTAGLFSQAAETHLFFAGPHIGQWKNEVQIQQDLHKVILAGALLMTLLFMFFILSRRKNFFLLIPVLALAIVAGTLAVHLFWEAIHGLTLAFGSGLIGISMDYAFHGWKKKHDPLLWRSNLLSFLTTLTAFFLLIFFTSPLIKQLAVFSSTGLTVSFLLCFFISKSGKWQNPPLNLKIPQLPRNPSFGITLVFVGAAVVSLFYLKADFSLSRMDYAAALQPPSIRNSEFEKSKNSLAFVGTPKQSVEDLHRIQEWSTQNQVPYLSPASFETAVGDPEIIAEAWEKLACDPNSYLFELQKQPTYSKLFSGFFEKISCKNIRGYKKAKTGVIEELFTAGTEVISLLKPENTFTQKALKSSYPQTFIVSDLTQKFPELLRKEIFRFLGTIIVLAFLLLTFYFKFSTFLVFVPVLGGWCGMLVFQWLTHRDLTFISFISMLILFGLTLDYGIFSTTYLREKLNLQEAFGSIAVSAGTSIAGFSPLALSLHPVLQDMGFTITFGLTGACLTTFLIYPHAKLSPSANV